MTESAPAVTLPASVPPPWPGWIGAPGGSRWWVSEDAARSALAPTFGVLETGKVFFRRSGSWIRMRSKPVHRHPHGWFTDDNDVPLTVQRRRGANGTYSFRRFTLSDIERMAWAVYRHEIIDIVAWYEANPMTGKRGAARTDRYRERAAAAEGRLLATIEIIKWIARLYDLIPPALPSAPAGERLTAPRTPDAIPS